MSKEPPVQIMGLWRINNEQSIQDLESCDDSNHITIRFEDLLTDPANVLGKIYSKLGIGEVPADVQDAVFTHDNSLDNIAHHKYNRPLNIENIQRWDEIDQGVWDRYIEKASIIHTMEKFGYLPKKT